MNGILTAVVLFASAILKVNAVVDDIFELASSRKISYDYRSYNSQNLLLKAIEQLTPFHRDTGILGYAKIKYEDEISVTPEFSPIFGIKRVCTDGVVQVIDSILWDFTTQKKYQGIPRYTCEFPIFEVENHENNGYPVVNESNYIQIELCITRTGYYINFALRSFGKQTDRTKPVLPNCAYSLFAPVREVKRDGPDVIS
ncbi:hypothetical protein AX774_g2625 [Zancudomyces culisetae]|uniref:Uncharacterized protein n=1 Tax=Zancudomyces culisetae TaxID=1213189 RepID=A0A1R1PSB5_ZANCU|nr:hypothetical protein AX774_g2625 [Zancudomyces culisetae]|eukprot:OMH83870.1 hypothetical protein AX774_g2625 [Zancudomyces culisetae]